MSIRSVGARGEPNFARQLTILDEIVESSPEQRLPRMPVDQLRSITGVPFAIRLPASGNEVAFDAPHPLLKAAVYLAAREADACIGAEPMLPPSRSSPGCSA